MDIQIAAKTDVGLVRKNNEDSFVVCADLTTPNWECHETSEPIHLGKFGSLLVVADGMGGANAGEVASAIAIETVKDLFVPETLEKIVSNEAEIIPFLTKVIETADTNIRNKSKEDISTHGMGTTIVLTWILNGKAYLSWCGDSRCYLFNEKIGYLRLSNDHSYVQSLVDKGELDPEMAFDHPYSNIITQCLGDAENHAIPDSRIQQLRNGDVIMLCSDGLCGYCRDNQIADIVLENCNDVVVCRDKLVEAALEEGGFDNVTLAVAKIFISEEETASEEIGSTLDPKNKFLGLRKFLSKHLKK